MIITLLCHGIHFSCALLIKYVSSNFVNAKQKRKGNICDAGGFLPQKLFKDSSPRKRLYFFFIRRLRLAACFFSSLLNSPYSSQLNLYSQHCSLNNVQGCAINSPLVASTGWHPSNLRSVVAFCVITRKCHLVVEADLKEGIALQELHLEEIREGLVWLCTNAMWDWRAFQCTIFPAWCAFQCTGG